MERRHRQSEAGLQTVLQDKLRKKLSLSRRKPRREFLRSQGRLRSLMILERRRPRLRWILRIHVLWLRGSIAASFRNIPAMFPRVNGDRAAQSFPATQSMYA